VLLHVLTIIFFIIILYIHDQRCCSYDGFQVTRALNTSILSASSDLGVYIPEVRSDGPRRLSSTTMAPKDDQRFTLYGYAIVGWLLIIPFQYGWHISALNQIQAVLTCQGGKEPPSSAHGLPTCVPMNDAQFSSITSIFCLGGLLGSLACGNVMDKWGRKGAAKASAGMFALGAGLMGVAWNMSTLLAGRYCLIINIESLPFAKCIQQILHWCWRRWTLRYSPLPR
jgi:hypothetical protein